MSLLVDIQRLTERTYQRHTGVNFEEFLIGKSRFEDLCTHTRHCQQLSPIARVFFRNAGDRLYLAIYFHRVLIHELESNDPRRGLNEKNIQPFMVFIEEINHAIHGALKFIESNRTAPLNEEFVRDLELQAKVDTYLLLKYFAACFNKSKQLEGMDRLWLRYHVFGTQDLDYESFVLAERYREAVDFGEKFSRFLDNLPVPERQSELSRFRTMSYRRKKAYIALLPD